jgi:hypothetical protein
LREGIKLQTKGTKLLRGGIKLQTKGTKLLRDRFLWDIATDSLIKNKRKKFHKGREREKREITEGDGNANDTGFDIR